MTPMVKLMHLNWCRNQLRSDLSKRDSKSVSVSEAYIITILFIHEYTKWINENKR